MCEATKRREPTLENLKATLGDGVVLTVRKVEVDGFNGKTRVFNPAWEVWNGIVQTVVELFHASGLYAQGLVASDDGSGLVFWVPFEQQEYPETSRRIETLARLLTQLDAWESYQTAAAAAPREYIERLRKQREQEATTP